MLSMGRRIGKRFKKKKKKGVKWGREGRLVKPGIPMVHSQIYASKNVLLPFEELNYGIEK